MALDLLLLFLILVGGGGSLSVILLAWKWTRWKGEDLHYMLMKRFIEEM